MSATPLYQHLQSATRILRAGGVIAYPTETVYGLGCDPFDEAAVARLLAIKSRPVEKGLILVASDLAQLDGLVSLTADQRRRLEAGWPEATTCLIRAGDGVPSWIRGAHRTVAVRVTRHPLARRLAAALGTPLVSTSANRAGRPAAVNRFQVARQLGMDLDFIVTGEAGGGPPSTIIDLDSGRVLRGRGAS